MSGRTFALCYHAVSADWPDALAVEPDALERQVRWFLDRGYEAVTFERLVASEPTGKRIAITFDDAYLSVYEQAFPRLRALGAPATVFVPSGQVGREMSWPGIDHWLDTVWHAELRSMSWDQLRELAGSGWEIGSHTRTHPRLSELDDTGLAEELLRSRRDCEREIGRECRTIAYPYGDFDDRVAVATQAAGYVAAAALVARAPRRSTRPDPMRIPRVAVYRGDALVRVQLKAWLLARFPAVWNLLLAVRPSAREERPARAG